MLNDWVLSFDYQNLTKQYSEIVENNKCFLSFNYSSTLEKVYGISPKNILHLHGKATPRPSPHPSDVELAHSELIIGHSLESYDFANPRKNSPNISSIPKRTNPVCNYIVSENEPEFIAYFNHSKKNCSAIICDNEVFFNKIRGIQKLFIFGHSLSDVDLPYFKKISENLCKEDIEIVIYDCQDCLKCRKKVASRIFTKADISCVAT